MGKFFDKFPTIVYDNMSCKNIMARVTLDSQTRNTPEIFLPYTINDDVRVDHVADRYYGDSYFDWMVYIANNIIDPYYDYYKTNDEFNEFIKKKYGSVEKSHDLIVFFRNNWYEDTTNTLDVQFYDSLIARHKKYWDPKINTSNRIMGYVRKKGEWICQTNKIRLLACDIQYFTDSSIGEILVQNLNGVQVASGVIAGYSDTGIVVDRIRGEFVSTAGNVIFLKYVGTKSTVTEVTNPAEYTSNGVLSGSDNIPNDEAIYWSPVSAYDYEQEQNESRKHINLIRSSYKNNIEKQITDLLRE